jgi:hypothetical protein
MRSHEFDEDDALLGDVGMTEEEKYKDCERFCFLCPKCKKEVIIDSVFTGAVSYKLFNV